MGIIALLVVLAYGNILNHGFVWDDYDIIVNNPLLQKLGNIPSFFLTEDKVVAATGYYRPLTYISFALDRALWGLNPLGYNLVNLLLHILVALLFFATVKTLFEKEELAFVAAAIFALHPLAGETVNFHAGGRNTLLSACFALLSLLFYLRDRRLPAVGFFTLAIFSKEFALLLPLVFLFIDYRVLRVKVRPGRYLPYLMPVACFLVLRSFAVQKANFLEGFRFSGQLWLTPYLAVRYLLNMIWPFRLKVMYDESTTITICILSLLLVILLIVAVCMLKREKDLSFSGFWFLLFLLPVVNIIPLVSNSLIADRYAYFSLMGFALALAAFICRGNKRVATVALLALCVAYTVVDLRQNRAWKDEAALFTRMTHDAPGMFIGFRNLGLYFYNRGDMANALPCLVAASEKPDIPAQFLTGAASIFVEANRLDKAEELLRKAQAGEPTNPEPYILLKMIYERKGNRALADSCLARGREKVPDFEGELARMAGDFCREGEKFIAERRYMSARNILWRALNARPDFVPALVAMGRLGYEQGEYAEAAGYLEKAVKIDPANATARQSLDLVRVKQGRTPAR
jgi:protein O-mannosyl-transferase